MAKTKRAQLEILQSDSRVEDREDDKRTFCRFAFNGIPVRYKDLKIGDKGYAMCKDIGAGGARLECGQEIKPKKPLEMWFDVADGFEPMHFLGKVMWSRLSGNSWEMGIAFDKPKFMSMARIMKSYEN